MEYMINTYNPNAHKIDFENSIFKNKESKPEPKAANNGILSESAQENILKTDVKNKNRFKVQENYIKDGMLKVLSKVLFESFYNSIPLDKGFKLNYKNTLYRELKESIGSLNPDIFDTYKQLSKKSEFLSEICKFCMESVKKKEKKICDKEEEFPNEFKLDGELVNDVDEYIEKNDDLTDLSQITKEKVTDTIVNEKEKSDKEKELLDDIVEESVFLIKNPDKALEEHTLFKSFNINTYKKVLKENVDEYFTTDDNGNKKVNLELVLAESIIRYTLHEFMNTSNIKEYSPSDIKQLCESLVYDNL